jgi:hypothetical protein
VFDSASLFYHLEEFSLNIDSPAGVSVKDKSETADCPIVTNRSAPSSENLVNIISLQLSKPLAGDELWLSTAVDSVVSTRCPESIPVFLGQLDETVDGTVLVVKVIAKRIIAFAAVPSGEAHSRVESDKIVLSHYSFLPYSTIILHLSLFFTERKSF